MPKKPVSKVLYIPTSCQGFAKGNKFNADVAEVWKAREGKLVSIAIYFDTAYFQKSMS